MAYLVLARKYRPQKLSEVIGQEHITGLLEKAITSQRIAHAFLFCGPRGIGKTSCARILAKSLNCQKGSSANPCGECVSCKEIAADTSFDVLEIDGASNRGIDEIRTLRDNVKFAPAYGRYKIYIVDEVHMLTPEAFNALLKTLEEPPEHVKFIFATTSPNKVPSTIISRCQRFDFKRMGMTNLQAHLLEICKKEKLQIEEAALFAIAKAAQGSMRDALSILDQLSALNERKIEGRDVYAMLGMVETELLFELTDALARKNATRALQVLEQTADQGKDVRQLIKDLIEHFRNLMILKIGGKTLGKMVDYPIVAKDRLLEQSHLLTLKEIIIGIEMFIESQETARVTGHERMALEVGLAKLTYQGEAKTAASPQAASPATPVPKAQSPAAGNAAAARTSPMEVLKNQKGQVALSREEPGAEEVEAERSVATEALTLEQVKSSWNAITHAISREKMSLATCIQEGSPYEVKANKIIVAFSKDHVFQKDSLEDKGAARLVENIFAEKLGVAVRVEYRIVEDFKSTEHEPLVKSALEEFGGKVVNKWHNE